MRTINSCLIFVIALTLYSCFGGGDEKPMGEPRDIEEIVGFWRHPQAVLDIYPAQIHYESRFGSTSKSLDVPIMAYDGERMLAGIPFMKTTFVIDSLPFEGDDGKRHIIIDGHEYVEVLEPADPVFQRDRLSMQEQDQEEYEIVFTLTMEEMFEAIDTQNKDKMASLFVPGTLDPQKIEWEAFSQIKQLEGKAQQDFKAGILSENGQLQIGVVYSELNQEFTMLFKDVEGDWKVTEFRFDSIRKE